ncbi:MAG: hypothetical protein ACFFCS_19770 [Candidatus Hodarchaeota archaeon]
MNEITWFYLIDESGSPIASIEKYVQGGSGNINAFLSHFLFAIKSATKGLKDGEVKIMSIAGGKFFITRDSATQYDFVIKATKDAVPDSINPVLHAIKRKFNDIFIDFPKLSLLRKGELIKEFQESIKNLLQDLDETNLDRFLKKKNN